MKANSLLLNVEHLTTRFFTERGEIGAVEDVSLTVNEGEAIGIVGESGSGKSVTALSVLGLVPMPGEVVSGRVLLRGTDLLTLSQREMRQVRRVWTMQQPDEEFVLEQRRQVSDHRGFIEQPQQSDQHLERRLVQALYGEGLELCTRSPAW